MVCEDGKVLTQIERQQYRYLIQCGKLLSPGSCIQRETPFIDTSSSYVNNANNLAKTKMVCPNGFALQSFRTQTQGEEATSISFAYTCCAAGSGLSIATVAGGLDTNFLLPWEGVYCPAGRGPFDYLNYSQRTAFDGSNNTLAYSLHFDVSSSKWCLSGEGIKDCSSGAENVLNPSVRSETWQAVAVTNFDGDCVRGQVTQPMPLKASSSGTRFAELSFKFAKVSEQKEIPLCRAKQQGTHPESIVDGADDPCQTAGDLTMSDVFNCFNREAKRQEDIHFLSQLMLNQASRAEMREAYRGGACAFFPDIQSTAYTFGNVLKPGRACQVQNELVFLNQDFASKDYFEDLQQSLFDVSNADCSGTKLAFARTLCDLHCVKAAVVEGNERVEASLARISSQWDALTEDEREWHYTAYKKAAEDEDKNISVDSQSPAALVAHRVALFAERTDQLLSLRQQAVKAHEASVTAVKERQQMIGKRMNAVEEIRDHAARSLLLELDSTWWSIRSKLDMHLHIQHDFLSDLGKGVSLLQGFTQQCSVEWQQLQSGLQRLTSTEGEFQKGLQTMWLEVVPKVGLLADQLLHGRAFSLLLDFDASALDLQTLKRQTLGNSTAASEACVEKMLQSLPHAFDDGLTAQMLLQVRALFSELATVRDRFHFEGLGEPEDTGILASAMRQTEDAHESARVAVMPVLIRQLASKACQEDSAREPAESFLQVFQKHRSKEVKGERSYGPRTQVPLDEAPSAKSVGMRTRESLESGESDVKTSDTFLQISQLRGRASGAGHHGQSGHTKHGHTVRGAHGLSAHSLKAHLVHHDQEPPPVHHRHRESREKRGRRQASQSSLDSFDHADHAAQTSQDSFEERLSHLSPQSLLSHSEQLEQKAHGRDAHGRVPGRPLPNAFFNDHQHMGLPQWFEKKKATARSLMFEKCPEKKRPRVSALATSNTTNQSSVKVECNSGQLVGYWNESEFISRCCEENYCVGCAVLNTSTSTCEQCMAGYARKEIANRTECVICDDDRAWQDENGKTCWDFENEEFCSNGIPPGDNTPFQSLRLGQR